LKLSVCLRDRSASDTEVGGQRPRRGQTRARAEAAVADRLAQARFDPVPAADAGIDRQLEGGTWRETPFFDSRERAALALAEAMTLLPANGVPDDVYEAAAREFSPEELGNLIGAIIAINAWNRVGVGTGMQPPAELPAAVA
jgi:alkylhydroperoxidase family enzyme